MIKPNHSGMEINPRGIQNQNMIDTLLYNFSYSVPTIPSVCPAEEKSVLKMISKQCDSNNIKN